MLWDNFRAISKHKLTEEQAKLIEKACSLLDNDSIDVIISDGNLRPNLMAMIILVEKARRSNEFVLFKNTVLEYFTNDGNLTPKGKVLMFDVIVCHENYKVIFDF